MSFDDFNRLPRYRTRKERLGEAVDRQLGNARTKVREMTGLDEPSMTLEDAARMTESAMAAAIRHARYADTGEDFDEPPARAPPVTATPATSARPVATGTAAAAETSPDGEVEEVAEKPESSYGKINEAMLAEVLAELETFKGQNADDGPKAQIRRLEATGRGHVRRLNAKRPDGKEHKVKPMMLHSVDVGNPGTGKTTMAKVKSKLEVALGLYKDHPSVGAHLEEGFEPHEMLKLVMQRNPVVENGVMLIEATDLRSPFANQSGLLTKAYFEYAKMLGVRKIVIDEANKMVSGDKDTEGGLLVTALVAAMTQDMEYLSVNILGYEDKILPMLAAADKGLARRIVITRYEDFSRDELVEVALGQLENKYGQEASREDVEAIVDEIYKGQGKEGYANAGAVEQMFDYAGQERDARLAELERSGTEVSDDDYFRFTREDLFNGLRVAQSGKDFSEGEAGELSLSDLKLLKNLSGLDDETEEAGDAK